MDCLDGGDLTRVEADLVLELQQVRGTRRPVQFRGECESPPATAPELLQIVVGQALDLPRLHPRIGRMAVLLRNGGEGDEEDGGGQADTDSVDSDGVDTDHGEFLQPHDP